MSATYRAAVEMAAAITVSYRAKYGDEPFPTVKGKLMPLIEARASRNGVDNIYVKQFKEKMLPIAGQLRRIEESNGVYQSVEQHGVIYLCPSLDLEWQRFIAVKEASHLLLDKPEDYVHSATDVDQLLLCLAQFGAEATTKQYESEMRAQVCAFELLMPKDTREKLHAHYREGIISAADIAKAAQIPVTTVRLIMSDGYRSMINPMYDAVRNDQSHLAAEAIEAQKDCGDTAD